MPSQSKVAKPHENLSHNRYNTGYGGIGSCLAFLFWEVDLRILAVFACCFILPTVAIAQEDSVRDPTKDEYCRQLYECYGEIRSDCFLIDDPVMIPIGCQLIGNCELDESCPDSIEEVNFVPSDCKPWKLTIRLKFCEDAFWHCKKVAGYGNCYDEALANACSTMRLYAKSQCKHVECYKIYVCKKPCPTQSCKKVKRFRLFNRR